MLKNHIKFILGIPLVMVLNLHSKYTGKYVYIWITITQWKLMVYKNMDRIEAANYIKNK